MRRRTPWVLLACVHLGSALAIAPAVDARPDEERPLKDRTLEELLETEVSVPTRVSTPLRQSPGVVTLITRKEIVTAGARDLIDVLSLVPGFFFGVDVQGVVGVGFRGNWGHEGKVLLLVDGQELNEGLYLTLQFGNHIPVELIERVEVMRGPGSVIYGGYAELAVINIVTRGADELAGVSMTTTYGRMERGLGRRNLSAQIGRVFPEWGGLALSVSGVIGEGRRSDAVYRDVMGNSYRLTNAHLDPAWLDVGVGYKGLGLRYIYDGHYTGTRDAFDESLSREVVTEYLGHYLDVKHAWTARAGLTITPRLSYKRQTPWRVRDLAEGRPTYYDKTVERYLANVLASWDATEHVNVLAGAETYVDRAQLNNVANVGVGLQQPFAGETTSSFRTLAGYAQVTVEHSLVNVAAGARYEHNSRYGGKFVPRLGVTKVMGDIHVKAIFSQAFKSPGHENFGLNPDIRPETTTTGELEVGYALGEHIFIGANLFDTTIRDPIVFTFAGTESYENFEQTGTRGAEAEVRVQHARGRAAAKYSFYTAADKNEVPAYEVPGRSNVLRGFPQHKLTVDGRVPLRDGVGLNGQMLYMGARYGTLEGGVTSREGPDVLVNLFVHWENARVRGLEVGVGVFDVLDHGLRYLQPYDSGHAPLPGPTREYVVRATYSHPLD